MRKISVTLRGNRPEEAPVYDKQLKTAYNLLETLSVCADDKKREF